MTLYSINCLSKSQFSQIFFIPFLKSQFLQIIFNPLSKSQFAQIIFIPLSKSQFSQIIFVPIPDQILNISHNLLEVLPPVVTSLTTLTELYADNIGTVDLAPLCKLTALVKLSARHNLIPAIPAKLSDLPLAVLDIAALPRFPCGTSFSLQSVKTFVNKYAVYRRIPEKVCPFIGIIYSPS